jgi:hypothetical protein
MTTDSCRLQMLPPAGNAPSCSFGQANSCRRDVVCSEHRTARSLRAALTRLRRTRSVHLLGSYDVADGTEAHRGRAQPAPCTIMDAVCLSGHYR